MIRDINTGSLQLTASNKEAITKLLQKHRKTLADMMKQSELDASLDRDPEFEKKENEVFETIIYLEEALLLCELSAHERAQAIIYMENKISELEQSVVTCRMQRGTDSELLKKEIALVKNLNEQRNRLRFIKANEQSV